MTQSINTAVASVVVGIALIAMALFALPALTQAADYAYVDAQGEVRSVTAPDWMTAIQTAANIHIHSGVYLLKGLADFAHLQDAN